MFFQEKFLEPLSLPHTCWPLGKPARYQKEVQHDQYSPGATCKCCPAQIKLLPCTMVINQRWVTLCRDSQSSAYFKTKSDLWDEYKALKAQEGFPRGIRQHFYLAEGRGLLSATNVGSGGSYHACVRTLLWSTGHNSRNISWTHSLLFRPIRILSPSNPSSVTLPGLPL